MRRSVAYERMMAAVGSAGYRRGQARLRRYGLGWEFAGTMEHPGRPYRTTTGTSYSYRTRWWALTLRSLVRTVEAIFKPGLLDPSGDALHPACNRCGRPIGEHLAYHSPVDTPNLYEAPGWVGLYCPPETGRPTDPPEAP